jgi:hypothetical protein
MKNLRMRSPFIQIFAIKLAISAALVWIFTNGVLASELAPDDTLLGPHRELTSPTFDRLFLTAKERQKLDEIRRNGGRVDTPAAEEAPATPTAKATDDSVLLSGVLFRGDGKYMVWINGQSALSDDRPDAQVPASRLHKGNERIPLEKNGEKMFLKPGQIWLPDEGKAVESYTVPTGSSTPKALGP